jgi:hypothetical protein
MAAMTRADLDQARRLRVKNIAIALALAALVVLFFVISIVRMKGNMG